MQQPTEVQKKGSMKIEEFRYEVRPWIYNGTHGGEEKALLISVEINGKRYTEQKVLPNQQPFENELEYYTRIATESLKMFTKQLEDNA